jgi:hypothetical protein
VERRKGGKARDRRFINHSAALAHLRLPCRGVSRRLATLTPLSAAHYSPVPLDARTQLYTHHKAKPCIGIFLHLLGFKQQRSPLRFTPHLFQTGCEILCLHPYLLQCLVYINNNSLNEILSSLTCVLGLRDDPVI